MTDDPNLTTPPSTASPWTGRLALGCGGAALAAVLAVGGLVWWWQASTAAAERAALEAQAEAAEQTFGPALEQLAGESDARPDDPARPPRERPYDIDQTIRVVHEIDLALKDTSSFETWLKQLGRQDYRDVAPEVLDARRELLDKIRELYARQTEAEQQEALWEYTQALLLETASVVEVDGELGMLGPTGSLSFDRDNAKALLQDFRERQAIRQDRIRYLAEAQDELFEALLTYSETYYGYLEAWDRLCVLRDRAYLAAARADWPTVEAAAEAAMQMSPTEREAHLLYAQALIEQGDPERLSEAQRVLEDYVEQHPRHTAPAFLLLGALARARGDDAAARLHLEQSAAYFPKQADHLADLLDPYKMRQFLQKSREGTRIVEQYQATMLGAGYFSPDLQLARAAYERGDVRAGHDKVLDHFARRRAQGDWAFLLSDLVFCETLLGEHFRELFPEAGWLDLTRGENLLTSGLSVGVENRSDRTLHNAQLVLVVQYTGMLPGSYRTIPVPREVPEVAPHARTDFGTVQVDTEVHGTPKGVADLVETRAILLTNEAVAWVDTDAYKAQLADTQRTRRRAGEPPPGDGTPWFEALEQRTEATRQTLAGRTLFEIDPAMLTKDGVTVRLPREIAALQPVFRLRYGDTTYTASENRLDDEHVTLRFAAVEHFEGEGDAPPTLPAGDVELSIATLFGEFGLVWSPDGSVRLR